jgi:anti-sigma regulatory factor (Ser/Thr protein kinase)
MSLPSAPAEGGGEPAATALGRVGASFAADLHSPAAARRLVDQAAGNWGLQRLADVAALLTSEVVTNAVQHAGTAVHVTVTRQATGMRVEVCDARPRQPLQLEDDRDIEERGRGLVLVASLSTRWSVVANGAMKCVWFELDADRRTP